MARETRYLGDFLKPSKEKGRGGLPLLSVTLNKGLVMRDSINRKMETNINPEGHLLVEEAA